MGKTMQLMKGSKGDIDMETYAKFGKVNGLEKGQPSSIRTVESFQIGERGFWNNVNRNHSAQTLTTPRKTTVEKSIL